MHFHKGKCFQIKLNSLWPYLHWKTDYDFVLKCYQSSCLRPVLKMSVGQKFRLKMKSKGSDDGTPACPGALSACHGGNGLLRTGQWSQEELKGLPPWPQSVPVCLSQGFVWLAHIHSNCSPHIVLWLRQLCSLREATHSQVALTFPHFLRGYSAMPELKHRSIMWFR